MYSTFGVMNAGLLFGNNVMLTHLLDKASYGAIGVATSYLVIATAIVTANGLGLVGVRRSQLDDAGFARFDEAYVGTLQVGALALFLGLACYSLVAESLGALVVLVPAYLYVLSLNDYHSAILVQRHDALRFGKAAFLSRAAGLLATFGFISLKLPSVVAYFAGLTVGELLSTLYRRRSHELFGVWFLRYARPWLNDERRELLRYGLAFTPLLLLGWASNGVDRLVIQKNLGLEAVAIYSFGMVVSQSVNVLNSAVTNTVMARIYSKLATSQPVLEYFNKFILAYSALSFLALLAFERFAALFIRLVAGEQYAHSAPVAAILVLSVALNGLYRICITVTDYYKRAAAKTGLSVASVAAMLGCVLLTVKVGGVAAVAWSVAAGNLVMAIGAYALARRYIAMFHRPVEI